MKRAILPIIALLALAGCKQQNVTPVGPGLYAVEYHGHEYLINPNGGLLHSDSCPCWEKYEEMETIYE